MIQRVVIAVCCLSALALAPSVFAQEQGAHDQNAALEAWNKAAQPGEFHEFLGKKAGKWKIAGKMWMQPGAEPIPSESVGEAEMILGGRYLKEEMTGTSMGMPFEGMGITGFDNTSGVVTSIWYDNMGTTTSILTGKYAKPGDPLELSGTMVDPASGLEMQVRTLTTFVSADEHRFKYFAAMGSMGEAKLMELIYTRLQ